jgi:hypothetical protein
MGYIPPTSDNALNHICPLSKGDVRGLFDLKAELQAEGLGRRGIEMHNTTEMCRVLYLHDWTDLHEWADALVELGDLTDDEIGEMVADPDPVPAVVE